MLRVCLQRSHKESSEEQEEEQEEEGRAGASRRTEASAFANPLLVQVPKPEAHNPNPETRNQKPETLTER